MLWCDQFKESSYKDLGTYGKAQKIINMSFKYLFCCEDAEEHYAHFQYCHTVGAIVSTIDRPVIGLCSMSRCE